MPPAPSTSSMRYSPTESPSVRSSAMRLPCTVVIMGSRIRLSGYMHFATGRNGNPFRDTTGDVLGITRRPTGARYGPRMNDDSTPPDAADDAPLQLDRAEPVGGAGPAPSAGPLTCAACRQPIAEHYFELNGNVACGPCRDGIVQQLQGPLGRRRFWRAFWFGSGAALVSAILWYAVSAITGYQIGLVAVAVGFIVGLAVKKGGEGRGGRKLQVLALLLTYGAMAAANI